MQRGINDAMRMKATERDEEKIIYIFDVVCERECEWKWLHCVRTYSLSSQAEK